MNVKNIFIATVIAAVPVLSHAQAKDPAATPGIDKRQEIQQKRIDQGVQSGELNKRETARLERHQAGIDKMENKAKADGTVTKKERAAIHHVQNNESRRIHRQKHDRQRAK
jgi:hypothetical protein